MRVPPALQAREQLSVLLRHSGRVGGADLAHELPGHGFRDGAQHDLLAQLPLLRLGARADERKGGGALRHKPSLAHRDEQLQST